MADGPIPQVTITSPPATRTSVPNAPRVNSVASSASKIQVQLAAENAPLRLVYGRAMLGAQIADVMFYQARLVIVAVWGRGPWNQIEQVYLDDKVPVTSIAVTNYTGSQTAPDPTLVAAYAAQSPSIAYGDILPGVAYSVIRLPAAITTGFPRITAIVQGLKVYDPRSATTVYSDNPALAIADLQTSSLYGAAGQVDWTSVADAANACDALVSGSEKRRTMGLVVDQVRPLNDWLEAMRVYAGCFLSRAGAKLTLVPDRPAASSFTFSESAPANCRIRNLKRRSKRDVPTVSAVRYTDTSIVPWRDAYAYAYAAGALSGSVPWKIRELALPGITRASQANREAIEALNKLQVTDITFDVEAQDEAIAVTVGSVVTATANVGLAARQARVLAINTRSVARPILSCEAYDATVYSDAIIAGPSVVDTTLPDPNHPPTPVSLVLVEELFQIQAAGLYLSRIKGTCTAPSTFPEGFVRDYRIEVSLAGAIICSGISATGEFRTPQLQEGNTYNVSVWLRSATGAWSDTPATASLLVTGNPPVPQDVANFLARGVGPRVFMTWSLNPERNLVDYEIRYGSTNVWSAGTLITRTAAAGFIAEALPAGTWYFMVKARNNARTVANPDGAYSTNAATVQLTLSLDTQFLIRATYPFTSPTLTAMTLYTLEGDATKYYITDFGDGVGFGADNTNDTIGTFGDSLVNRVLAAPHTSGTSQWVSEVYDYGQALFGDWNWAGNVQALDGGAFTVTLSLKVNIGDAWTDFTTFPARMSARYAQLTIKATTTNTMLVKLDSIGPAVTLDVAYKSETFTATTSATLPVQVSLTGKYSLYRAIPLAPKGTTAKMAVYNNVSLSPSGANTFDVYAFDDLGNQVAVEVSGTFQGV